MSERGRGDCAASPISSDRASAGGSGAGADLGEYVTVKEIARRASMSEKSIRNFIRNDALPHYRNSSTGKIWVRWNEFTAWMEGRRIQLQGDDGLLGILRELKGAEARN
jgi:hypothetical protein